MLYNFNLVSTGILPALYCKCTAISDHATFTIKSGTLDYQFLNFNVLPTVM